MQPCKTDNSVTCGGAWSNSVYETAPPECEQEVTVTYNGPIDIQPEIVGVYIQTGQVEQNRVVYKHELKETYLFTSPNKNWHIHSEVGESAWIYDGPAACPYKEDLTSKPWNHWTSEAGWYHIDGFEIIPGRLETEKCASSCWNEDANGDCILSDAEECKGTVTCSPF